MKTVLQSAIAILGYFLLLSCNNKSATAYTLPRLILKQDSGYITKKEVLPFLLASGITDTIQGFWKTRFPNDGDTVGRYFRSSTQNGHLAICRSLYKVDSVETFVIMEVAGDGELLSYGIHSSIDYWCDEDAVKNAHKIGRYFIIKGCGHGSGYGSEYADIFDRADTGSVLNYVFLSNYSSHGMPDYEYAQMVTSQIDIRDSGILIHYTIQKGAWKRNYDIKWVKDHIADVMYKRKNNRWAATDSALLENIDME